MQKCFVDETKLKSTVAKNITEYRKQLNLTQFELAEKINYSDKSVSKWERAESIPDAVILKRLADLFGISVDRLLSDNPDKKRLGSFVKKMLLRKQIIISLAVLLTFFIATVIFSFLTMASIPMAWTAFIFAIPASAVVLIVFSSIWGKKIATTLSVSLLSWSVALILFLFIDTKPYLFFIIAAAFQIMIIFWHFLKRRNRKES